MLPQLQLPPPQSAPARVFADRRLLTRSGLALGQSRLRYWSTVEPRVQATLARYRQSATRIPDAALRDVAMTKLNAQRFHAQAAATLATLAPRDLRASAVDAIVATEVLYDYMDGLTERPVDDPLTTGRQLAQAFSDAVEPDEPPARDYYRFYPYSDDGGYLEQLVNDARTAFSRLPAASSVAQSANQCIARFAEAQLRVHAVPQLGTRQLRDWAATHAGDTGLDWREFFAGATSSVIGLHALLSAAADRRTTPAHASGLATFYLYTGVIVTMLDSMIDYDYDLNSTGQPGFIRYYDDPGVLERRLPEVARAATALAAGIPNGAHHVMTLVGAVAFYTTAPTARTPIAAPLCAAIQRELRPLIWPTRGVVRGWRLANRLRGHDRSVAGHLGQNMGATVVNHRASAVSPRLTAGR